MNHFTCTAEALNNAWALITPTMALVKPVRVWESQVLFEVRDGSLYLHVVNELGATSTTVETISADEPLLASVLPADIPALPHFTGVVRVTSEPISGNVLTFRSNTIQQVVPYQRGEDFPKPKMPVLGEALMRVPGKDLARRIRIASNAAADERHSMLDGALHILSTGTDLHMTSANPTRGITRIIWPQALPPFSHIVPAVNMQAVAKMAHQSEEVSVYGHREDRLVWAFDDTSFFYCRMIAGEFFKLDRMFGGRTVVSAEVSRPELLKIFTLIRNRYDPPVVRIVFQDGAVDVFSKQETERSLLESKVEGDLNTFIAINGKQLSEILGDLRSKSDRVRIMVQEVATGSYAFRVEVPGNDEFVHVAVPYDIRS